MNKKLILLGSAFLVFLFTLSDFYYEALTYDPMSVVSEKKSRSRETESALSRYSPGWSRDITGKNLFNPSRSGPKPPPPPSPPPPPPPPPPPKRPEVLLKGIVSNASGEYVSYIEIDKGKAVPMRKGEKLGEIEVVELSERKIVLQWKSERIVLSMENIRTIDNTQTGGSQITSPRPPRPTARSRRTFRQPETETEND
jgi:hypothetical protein